MIEIAVTLEGKPLRHTFVSHLRPFADPEVVLTDGAGRARFESLNRKSTFDLVVHAHNVAVRMLDGTSTSSSEKSLIFREKHHGDTLTIGRKDRSFPYYVIMDQCYEVYETVFRDIAPFTTASRGDFPFGGVTVEPHELKRSPAVDCRFPETIAPGRLPWVQPQSVTGGRPLMHLKAPIQDDRLFGSSAKPATTVPHEFAHAVHFALLPSMKRWLLAAKYGAWIAGELAGGKSGTHRTDRRTAPLIAFVESIGIFSQRFFLFATRVRPDLHGAELRAEFVEDELTAAPSLADVLPGYTRIGRRGADGRIEPTLTGASVEGAVYGAIFLDFAQRTSLATAVTCYVRCGGFSVRDYVEHARTVHKGKFSRDLDAVRSTWKLG